jgi:hypothetical protein
MAVVAVIADLSIFGQRLCKSEIRGRQDLERPIRQVDGVPSTADTDTRIKSRTAMR